MTFVQVNIQDAALRLVKLVEEVERHGTWVRICRDGEPVAELRPAVGVRDPLKTDPILAEVEIIDDPVLPLTEEDWPSDAH